MQRIKIDKNLNRKRMKITKSSHRKSKLINQKIMQDKLINNVYYYVIWLRKQQKNLRIKLVTLKNKNGRNL